MEKQESTSLEAETSPLHSMLVEPFDDGSQQASMQIDSDGKSSSLVDETVNLDSLKESMEAAMASIEPERQANSSVPPNENWGDDKQAQLRAMYLAGFRAASQAKSSKQNLRDNFENAQQESVEGGPQGVAPPGKTNAVLLPAGSVVAGVISLHPTVVSHDGSSNTARRNQSGDVSEKDSVSTRRLRRASSTSSNAASSPSLSSTSSPGATGSNPFPRKLMEMLTKEDAAIVSWLPAGDAFAVRDPDKFVTDVLPRYFRHTKLTSFQRQLNLYGFRRITKGKDSGAYRHELFHRDYPDKCHHMKRTKQKGVASPQLRARGGTNSANSSPLLTPEQSPSVYSIEPGALLSRSAPTTMLGRWVSVHGI